MTLAIQPTANSQAQVAAALQAALQDGWMAAALASAAGVQLVGSGTGAVEVLSAAAPSSGKAVVGAAVGGAVGGAALLCLAAAVFVVVRRRRRGAATGDRHRDALPVSAFLGPDGVGGGSGGKAKVGWGGHVFGECGPAGVETAIEDNAVATFETRPMAASVPSPPPRRAVLTAHQGPEPDGQGGSTPGRGGSCFSLL